MKSTMKRCIAVFVMLALALCLATAALADLTNGNSADGNTFPYDVTGRDGTNGSGGMTNGNGNIGNGTTNGSGGIGGGMTNGNDGIMDNGDMGDMLPPDKTLGDTDGDGMIEPPDEHDRATTPMTERPTENTGMAGSTSDKDGGFAWWGLLLALLIAAAVIVLIIALLPNRKTGNDDSHPDRS